MVLHKKPRMDRRAKVDQDELMSALDEVSGQTPQTSGQSAPGQAIGFAAEQNKMQARIEELEEKLKARASEDGSLSSRTVSVDEIEPNPWQPRRVFDETKLQELADSIEKFTLLQPPIIRIVTGADGKRHYQLIAGERRWRAVRLLGWKELPVLVVDIPDNLMISAAITENEEREGVADFHVAQSIKKACESYETLASFAQDTNLSRVKVYRYLSYFALPKQALEDLEDAPELLSSGYAYELKRLMESATEDGQEIFLALWARLKKGAINQESFLQTFDRKIKQPNDAGLSGARDIKKLFVGKQQAGTLTIERNKVTLRLDRRRLDEEKEKRLTELLSQMFAKTD